jgi:tetratricopeptide (TPR) repeat protein
LILWYLIYCENIRPDVMVIEPTWLAGSKALSSQVKQQYPDLALPGAELVAIYTQGAADPESRLWMTIQSILDVNQELRPVYWGMISGDTPFLENLAPEGPVFRYTALPADIDEAVLERNAAFWNSEIERLRDDPDDSNTAQDRLAGEIFPVYLNNQGLLFETLGRDDMAAWALGLALEFNPEHPLSRNNLGRLEARLGNHERAAEQYRLAISANGRMANAYYGLGNALGNLGRQDEAMEAYLEAVRLYPDYHEALTAVGRMYMMIGDNAYAVEQFLRAAEIEPDYAFAHRGLASAYLEMGLLDDARKSISRALELEPKSAPGLYALAKYYAKIGADDLAADALTRSFMHGGRDGIDVAMEDEDLEGIATELSKGEADT